MPKKVELRSVTEKERDTLEKLIKSQTYWNEHRHPYHWRKTYSLHPG